jgi:TetR/AcrR family transcriptional regulator, fatty acid biosynthesis regulator
MSGQIHIGQPQRKRLDPEVRRGLILDATAALVISEGLTAVNMERIARDAVVSKALVYSYFGNQTALLSELLLREYRAFQKEARTAATHVSGLQGLVRVTTRAYLDHVAVRGSLIQRLMVEPAIAAGLQEVESADRMVTAMFFAGQIAAEREVDPGDALIAAQLLMGLTGAAGDYLVSAGADPATLEPVVVSMIMSSLDGLKPR